MSIFRRHGPSSYLPLEIWFFIVAIALANLHLVTGRPGNGMIFVPQYVRAGEWWRMVTNPFVHVSWYHLLLDAGAFLLLYAGLEESRWVKRLSYVALCAAGSLLVSALAWPSLSRGLCGLSGVAHGLMAVMALEMMSGDSLDLRRVGLGCFLLVLGKSAMEAVTGQVLFSSLHFGQVGHPVAVCHAGGVLGGVIAFAVFRALHSGLQRLNHTGVVPTLEQCQFTGGHRWQSCL